MAQEANVIRGEIEETRNNLSDNLVRLEKQVLETVDLAKDGIQETVQFVKDGVEKFSPTYQVQKRPFAWVAGAVVAGVVAGRALGPSSHPKGTRTPGMWSDEFQIVKRLAFTTLFSALGEQAKRALPKFEKPIEEIVQSLKEKSSATV